ncbi:hypothetical protein HY251_19835, partial [bacterium]|nr:hypothetical protein [bacterium]
MSEEASIGSSEKRAPLRLGIGSEEELDRTGPQNGDSKPAPAGEVLGAVSSRAQERFSERQQILSFGEFLDAVLADPRHHARGAAQYLRDMFDWFGTRTVRGVAGP